MGVLLITVYPEYVPPKWNEHSINAVVDHVRAGETVTGFLAYPYTYLTRKLDATTYDAVNSIGTRVYGGPDDAGLVEGTDATAVVKAAITNGGLICFGEGTFEFSSRASGGAVPANLQGAITIPEQPAILRGAGIGKTIFKWTGADNGQFGLLSFQSSDAPSFTQQNITIEDLSVDCNSRLQYGIWGNGARNVQVKNTYVYGYKSVADWGVGILIGYFDRLWLENNIVIGSGTGTNIAGIFTTGGGGSYGRAFINDNYVEYNNVGIFAQEDRQQRVSVIGNKVAHVLEGIRVTGAVAMLVENGVISGNQVHDAQTNAILVGPYSRFITVANNIVEDSAASTGLYIYNSTDVTASGNVLYAPITTAGSSRIVISSNSLYAGNIRIRDGNDMITVNGNSIFFTSGEAITIYNYGGGVQPIRICVASNILQGNDTADTSGIRNNAQYCTIQGNTIRDYAYGVREYSPANYNIYISNILSSCATGASFVGANNIVKRNIGYVTEAFGNSTGTGAEQTIAHGLAGDLVPNSVAVVPTETGATVSSVWADATNIYCTVTNAKTYNWFASVN